MYRITFRKLQRLPWTELNQMLEQEDISVSVNTMDRFVITLYTVKDVTPSAPTPVPEPSTDGVPEYNPFTHKAGDKVRVNGQVTIL